MFVKVLKIAAAVALAVFVLGFKPNPAGSKPTASYCPSYK